MATKRADHVVLPLQVGKGAVSLLEFNVALAAEVDVVDTIVSYSIVGR